MTNEVGGSSSGTGVGFTGLLAITFIVLKLTGFIHWSWWWVLSPIWVPLIIAILLIALAVIAEAYSQGDRIFERKYWRK